MSEYYKRILLTLLEEAASYQPHGAMTTEDVSLIQLKLELAYRVAHRAVDQVLMGDIADLQAYVFSTVAVGRATPHSALSTTYADMVRTHIRDTAKTLGQPHGEFMPLDWEPVPSYRTLGWSLTALLVVFTLAAYWVS